MRPQTYTIEELLGSFIYDDLRVLYDFYNNDLVAALKLYLWLGGPGEMILPSLRTAIEEDRMDPEVGTALFTFYRDIIVPRLERERK